ncbi:hypothetical protein ACFQ0B_19810 [Nonomuraea thailandensis]
MPPFAAPVPDDEPQEPPKGRRPYTSPTAEPEDEPRRRRRVVNRPDKLVAGGPLRQDTATPQPDASDAPRPEAAASQAGAPDAPQAGATGSPRPDGADAPRPDAEDAPRPDGVPRPRPEGDAAAPAAGSPHQEAPAGNGERRDRTPPYRLVYPVPAEARQEAEEDRGEPGERDETEVRRVGRPPRAAPRGRTCWSRPPPWARRAPAAGTTGARPPPPYADPAPPAGAPGPSRSS